MPMFLRSVSVPRSRALTFRTKRKTRRLMLESLEDRRVLDAGHVQSFLSYPAGVLPENATQAWIRREAGSPIVSLTGAGQLHLKDPGADGDHIYYARPDFELDPTDSVILDAKLVVGLSATTGQLVLGGPTSLGVGFDDGQHLMLLGAEMDPGGSGKALFSLNWTGDAGTAKSFLVDNAQQAHTFRIIKHGEQSVEAGIYDPVADTYTSKISVPIAGFPGTYFGVPGFAFGAFSDAPGAGTSGSFWHGLGAVVGCTAVPASTEIGAECLDDAHGPPPGVMKTGLFGIQVENGNFQFTDSAGHFDFSGGSMLVGVNPDLTQGNFLPLFRLAGSVNYSGRRLHADAVLQEKVTGHDFTVFQGTWETDIWNARSSHLFDGQQSAFNEFHLAGLDVAFNGMDILFGGLALHGSFKLPDSLGGVSVGVANGNSIILSTGGISLNGASICLPSANFSLLDVLPVQTQDICVGYDANHDALRLQGKLTLPQIYNATADLSGSNYIEVAAGTADVVGSLHVEDVTFPFAGWGLRNADLFINTVTKEVRGNATVDLPTGISVAVGLGFFGGDLNYASLDVDGIDLPTVFPGVFLQRVAGSVDHLSPNDPDALLFSGGVGATFGPEITGLTLPKWAGGATLGGSLVRVDVNGDFDANHLAADGPYKILAGLASGTANVDLNWDQGTFSGGADLKLLNNMISLAGSFTADTNLNLTVSGSATLKLPKIACPIVCGQTLASAEAYFQYINDDDFSNDLVEAYGKVNLGWFGGLHYAGIRFRFDGHVDAINSSVDPVGQTFNIPAGTERFILAADWENDVGAVPFEIEGPDGTLYTEADFDNAMIGLLPEFADETSKSVGLLNPTPGDWTINIPDSDAIGEVTFHGFHDTVAPSVTITSLDSAARTIHFSATDTDSTATVELFYDTDNAGRDGRLIAAGLAESDGAGSHVWDTTGVRSGEYYVYAKATDENNPPVYLYSADKITVANQPPVLDAVGNQSVKETEKLTFQVHATDPNGERLSYSLDAGAPAGARINPTTGEFTWTPTESQGPSQYSVTIRVTDNGVGALSDSETFDIVVGEKNLPPQLATVFDQFTVIGNAIRFTAIANDRNVPANKLTFGLEPGAPQGASIDPDSGAFTWTPSQAQGPGTFDITVRVTDDGAPSASDTQSFQVTVGEGTAPPAPPWQNPRNPLDVNDDTFVVAQDALIIINEINSPTIIDGSGELPDSPGNVTTFYDVSGDGFLAPQDALLVINDVNSPSGGEAESPNTLLRAVAKDLPNGRGQFTAGNSFVAQGSLVSSTRLLSGAPATSTARPALSRRSIDSFFANHEPRSFANGQTLDEVLSTITRTRRFGHRPTTVDQVLTELAQRQSVCDVEGEVI